MESITLAADLDKVAVMHQTVEEGSHRRRVAEELGPIIDWRFDVMIVEARS